MLKLTLLSIALLTVFGSAAIAPALSEIALTFSHIPATQIKALLTAPALTMVFISPFIGALSHKFGQKKLLIIGLSCYIIGGIGGGLAPDYYLLFASRLVLGAGIGILMPMASGLIAEYYSGKERLRLMGWSSSATNFFGILSNLLVGFLALYNWRYGFSIYSIAIIVLVLVSIHIPGKPSSAVPKPKPEKLPLAVYLWAAGMFLFMIAIYAVPVNIALYIVENALGGPRESGIAMSCLSISAIIAGLLGVRVRALLGRYFVFALLTAVTAGFTLITSIISIPSIMVSLLIIGMGSGFLMPYLMYSATSSAKEGSSIGAMGIIATAASLGQFATPVILDGVAFQMGNSSIHFVFQLVGSCCGFAAIVNLLNTRLRSSKAKN